MASCSIIGGTAATKTAAGAGRVSSDAANRKKMFFTTSDLLDRMNSSIAEANPDSIPGAESSGGFELQRKMPDGSYRRAEESERAAADFQAKMKQASMAIAGYDPPKKIKWAKCQRQEGNALFVQGNYKEAMDVYLTCLVAMDQSSASDKENSGRNNSGLGDSDELLDIQIEKEIKLPVLLNLALSAIKIGMLSKAEEFCDFAIDTDSGRQSVKAYFRRGSVRMLMGHYVTAGSDLDKALELNYAKMSECEDGCNSENEENVILREKQRLRRLVNQADKNRRLQKTAMQKLFKSTESNNSTPSLYPELKGPILQNEEYQPSWFEWYMHMIGRCAQKMYDIIGDEEENEAVDVEADVKEKKL